MAQYIGDTCSSSILSQRLLLSVAEQLKVPLLNIARRAELADLRSESSSILADIQTTADAALLLLDSYVLGVQLAIQDEARFEVEPISVSSVLYDTGNQLDAIAKVYEVHLDLQIGGKYGTVMAHRRGLQAALVSLGYALIEALPAMEVPQLTLRLSAYRCRWGIVAGLYCTAEQLPAQVLRQGRQLYGKARQPLVGLTHTSGAGIFVADAILRAMQTQLTVSHYHKQYGLGAVLPLNPQLQLV